MSYPKAMIRTSAVDGQVVEATARVLAQNDSTPAWAAPTPDGYRARVLRVLEALRAAGYDVVRR